MWHTKKKAPIARGLCMNSLQVALYGANELLLRFLGWLLGCFFRDWFLCVLHRLILPKRKKFAIRRSQYDSYIRFFEGNVKKKMSFEVNRSSSEVQKDENHFET